MEDNRVDYKKLLVAGSNKGCGKICKRVWFISENGKLNRGTSRKVDNKQNTREAMDVFNGRLHH